MPPHPRRNTGTNPAGGPGGPERVLSVDQAKMKAAPDEKAQLEDSIVGFVTSVLKLDNAQLLKVEVQQIADQGPKADIKTQRNILTRLTTVAEAKYLNNNERSRLVGAILAGDTAKVEEFLHRNKMLDPKKSKETANELDKVFSLYRKGKTSEADFATAIAEIRAKEQVNNEQFEQLVENVAAEWTASSGSNEELKGIRTVISGFAEQGAKKRMEELARSAKRVADVARRGPNIDINATPGARSEENKKKRLPPKTWVYAKSLENFSKVANELAEDRFDTEEAFADIKDEDLLWTTFEFGSMQTVTGPDGLPRMEYVINDEFWKTIKESGKLDMTGSSEEEMRNTLSWMLMRAKQEYSRRMTRVAEEDSRRREGQGTRKFGRQMTPEQVMRAEDRESFGSYIERLNTQLEIAELSQDPELMRKSLENVNYRVEEYYAVLPDEIKKYVEKRNGMLYLKKLSEAEQKEFNQLYFSLSLSRARDMFREQVDQGSMYFDERAKPHLALQSIWGVENSLKDRVRLRTSMFYLGDAMWTGMHSGETLSKLFTPIEKTGQFYYHYLKQAETIYLRRDGDRLGAMPERLCDLTVYDMAKMFERVCDDPEMYPAAAKDEHGNIKEGMHRRWGTRLLSPTDIEDKGEIERLDKGFWNAVLKETMGEAEYNRLSADEKDSIFKTYGQTYINDVVWHLQGTHRLGELYENPSFAPGSLALPQRVPEAFWKIYRETRRVFMTVYHVGGVPEFAEYGDSYLGSVISYDAHNSMAHLTTKEGAKSMFFEGQADADKDAQVFADLMLGSIMDWGPSEEEFWQFGLGGETVEDLRKGINTARRKSAQETVDILNELDPEDWNYDEEMKKRYKGADITKDKVEGMITRMDWDKFTARTGIKIEGTTPLEKWRYFVNNFEERYYELEKFYGKRIPDTAIKFAILGEYTIYEKMVALASTPSDVQSWLDIAKTISGWNKADVPLQKLREGFHHITKKTMKGAWLKRWKTVGGRIQYAESNKNNKYPVPDTEKLLNVPTFGGPSRDSIYENRTGRDNPPEAIHQRLLEEARTAGFAIDDDEYKKEARKTWWRQFAPYGSPIQNILGLPLSTIEVMAKAMGFRDIEQFGEWFFEPFPEWFQNWIAIFGGNFKVK